MNKKLLSVLLTMLLCKVVCFGQNLDYFSPVGYQNPLLKSGQFITSLFYSSRISNSELNVISNENANRTINLIGYLGLTDFLTLRTSFIITPNHISGKVNPPGSGSDLMKFNISPRLTISYRPVENIEIYGYYSYLDQKTIYGDKRELRSIPVGFDPVAGEPIMEDQLVTQSGLGDVYYESTSFQIGFTYHGSIW